MEDTAHGRRPAGPGWYVVNATDAPWDFLPGLARSTDFGPPPKRPEFAVNITVLPPGEPNGMYHGESNHEDFLVLSGECLLIVEGHERRLRAWDFVHCPAWTRHIFVGTGDRDCVIVMIGGRARGPETNIEYPVDEVAQRHGAGVDEATNEPKQAYAAWPDVATLKFEPGTLGDLA